MLELLIKNGSLITKSFEALAAVIGIFTLKKYKGTAAAFFIVILVYLFLVDLLGSYTYYYNTFDFLKPVRNSVFKTNRWWYTIFFDLIALLLISIFYQKILKHKWHKIILKYATVLYLLISFVLIVSDIDKLFTRPYPLIYCLQLVLILCCSIFYFVEILQSDKVLQFSKSLYFYITIAIFVWWLIVTPLVFYEIYFINYDWNYIILKKQIYLAANVFMYATFAIGLIVSKPEYA